MSQYVILCLNSGSSSLKFALYRVGDADELRLASGAVENIGLSGGRLWIRGRDEKTLVDVRREFPTHNAAAAGVAESASMLGLPKPDAAGHRVVHGGPRYAEPRQVDGALLSDL
ncbi:MAG TPA: hypothetical protein VH681_14745, partial [Nitrospiraceae bacterium]